MKMINTKKKKKNVDGRATNLEGIGTRFREKVIYKQTLNRRRGEAEKILGNAKSSFGRIINI